MRKAMDSRLRGNDGSNANQVIPAKAGLIVRTAQTGTPSTPMRLSLLTVIPAKAEMTVRTAYSRRPPTVIPAQAGIHWCSSHTHAGAPDTPITGVPSVIPAQAGIHTALSAHKCHDARLEVSGGHP